MHIVTSEFKHFTYEWYIKKRINYVYMEIPVDISKMIYIPTGILLKKFALFKMNILY